MKNIQQAIHKLESKTNPDADKVSVTNVTSNGKYSADVKVSKGNNVLYEGRQHYPKPDIDDIAKKL